MKKLFLSFVLLLAAVTSFAESYTINFIGYESTSGDSSSSYSSSSELATVFQAGCVSYIASLGEGTDKVYAARTTESGVACGVKFGTSSVAGKLVINLANPTEVESVVFSAAMYGKSEGGDGFTVNDDKAFTLSAGNKVFENCVWTPSGKVSTITIAQNTAAKGRFYLQSITINTKGGSTPSEPTKDPDPEQDPEPTNPDVDVTPTTSAEGFAVATFDFTSKGSFGFANSTSVDGREFTAENLSVVAQLDAEKGNGPKYYSSGDAIRLYGSNTLKISSKSTILKVEYTWTWDSNNPAPTEGSCTVTEGYDFTPISIDASAKTQVNVWEGEANEVVLSRPSGSGHFRLKSLKITYDAGVDEAATPAARAILMDEIDKAKEVLDELSGWIGVNVFMYGQATYDKFSNTIETIEKKAKYIHTELGIYGAIDDLRSAQREVKPIFRGVNADYAIKNIATGLYLHVDEDGVSLSKEPTPINFHNLLLEKQQYIDQEKYYGFQIAYSCYLYNTPESKYLGMELNSTPVLQSKQLSQWYIAVDDNNAYAIATREENQTATGVTYDYYSLYANAAKKVVAGDISNPFVWFIEDYVAPTFDVPTEKEGEYAEEATSIVGTSTAVAPVAYFSANGAHLKSAQKGVNIVKMSDGSVRKIILK